MAESILLKSGSGFDPTTATATPDDVKVGVKFLGAGSDEVQVGTVPIIDKAVVALGINETYNISPGYHGGEDVISQSGIELVEGPIIDPTAGGQTIQVTGRVLTSDTYIQGIENLRPEVVKYGVRIGDVTGTYQGFPDEE